MENTPDSHWNGPDLPGEVYDEDPSAEEFFLLEEEHHCRVSCLETHAPVLTADEPPF